jgi:hypothetical protein
MSQRYQARMLAVQALSSVVVAASVVSLVRHHKRVSVTTGFTQS